MRVLLIEDDAVFADILKQSLIDNKYVVDVVDNGRDGLDFAQTPGQLYDLMVIDVGLPGLDGISLCQNLRESKDTTPILLMTAKDRPEEQIRALDTGADDYLTKPFDLDTFQARIRALMRRPKEASLPVLRIEQLELDPAECRVTYARQLLRLTPKEYGLLELLMRHPGRAFSRGDIIDHLWSFEDFPLEETVKSHIKSLRHKLRAAGASDWIENIYGMGYRLNPQLVQHTVLKDDASSITWVEPEASAIALTGAAPNNQAPPPSPSNPFNSTSAPTSLSEEFQAKMAGLWQEHQGLIRERLERLEDFAKAHQDSKVTTTIQAEAKTAAHKLAGVLGMFGRHDETQMASQIESDLETFSPQHPQPMVLLDRIQQLVSRVLPNVSSNIAPEPPILEPTATPRLQPLVQSWQILAVDDDPIVIQMLKDCLSTWGMQVTGLADPHQFWPTLSQVAPDLVILDVDMPDIDGITLCRAIRESSEWQAMPVVFLTRLKDTAVVQNLFVAGADDYVTKPVVSAELVARITNRLERLRLLQSLSTKDQLTGLANYAQSARSLTALFQEQQVAYFVLVIWPQLHEMILNYGHPVCHQVLRQWGQLIRSHFTTSAIVGYWGDGEFVVGLPQQAAVKLSERVQNLADVLNRQGLETLKLESVPLSCGWAMAEYPQQGESLQSLYKTAYQRLNPVFAHVH